MVINYFKTSAVTIIRKTLRLTFKYNVQDKHIEPVNEIKYLGLTLNAKLNWETRLDKI